jgi:hypothetical protein
MASTYHFCGYAQLVELLLVVCSRLGAVVGNKHELFAFATSNWAMVLAWESTTFTSQHLKCFRDSLIEMIAGPQDAYPSSQSAA